MSARDEFLKLSAALAGIPRDAPAYEETAAHLEEIGRGLSPRWIAEAGEHDAARFNVVLTATSPGAGALVGLRLAEVLGGDRNDWAQAIEAPPVTLERGLRRADAVALIAALADVERVERTERAEGAGPGVGREPPRWDLAELELREHRALSALMALRWLLPKPLYPVVAQPPLNRTWERRAPPEQWAPSADEPEEALHDDASVILEHPGPRPVGVLHALRELPRLAELGLGDLKTRLDKGSFAILEGATAEEAQALAERFEAMGAVVRQVLPRLTRPGPVLASEDTAMLEAGDPGLVALVADSEALSVAEFGRVWTGPHTTRPKHRQLVRWRWAELPVEPARRIDAVWAAVDDAIERRKARYVTCRLCRETKPPERMGQDEVCRACEERQLGAAH